MFLGCTLSAVFYGMTTIQVIVYYTSYPKDPLIHKLAAAALWALDSFHLILITHSVYHYTIGKIGSAFFPLDLIWSSKLQSLVNSVIILLVQGLYARRVWKLNGNSYGFLGYLAAGIILVGFGIGMALVAKLYQIHSLLQLADIKWAIRAQLVSATAIDVVITIVVFICLRKSQSVLTSLKSRLATVIMYTLISGFATSLCGIAAVLSFIFMPMTFIYAALGFVLTRLHVNSFLGLLNARPRNTTERTEATSSSHSLRSPTAPHDFRNQSGARSWQQSLSSPISADSPVKESSPSVYSQSTIGRSLHHKETYVPEEFVPRAI